MMSRQRGLVVVLMALTLALVAVAPAQAGRRWCQADPAFLIAGTQVNVVTAIWEEHQPAVTGPIAVTLFVPPDVEAIHLFSDDGYNGYGEVVSIVESPRLSVTGNGVRVLVEVTVPANRRNMPVNVLVVAADARTDSVSGSANNVVPVHLTVKPSS